MEWQSPSNGTIRKMYLICCEYANGESMQLGVVVSCARGSVDKVTGRVHLTTWEENEQVTCICSTVTRTTSRHGWTGRQREAHSRSCRASRHFDCAALKSSGFCCTMATPARVQHHWVLFTGCLLVLALALCPGKLQGHPYLSDARYYYYYNLISLYLTYLRVRRWLRRSFK